MDFWNPAPPSIHFRFDNRQKRFWRNFNLLVSLGKFIDYQSGKRNLVDGTEPAVFVPEVAKQHDVSESLLRYVARLQYS